MKRLLQVAANAHAFSINATGHEVSWFQNEDGLQPAIPLFFAYQTIEEVNQFVTVKPSSGSLAR